MRHLSKFCFGEQLFVNKIFCMETSSTISSKVQQYDADQSGFRKPLQGSTNTVKAPTATL